MEILVDDRLKNVAGEFEGELIRFGSDEFPDWKTVIESWTRIDEESQYLIERKDK